MNKKSLFPLGALALLVLLFSPSLLLAAEKNYLIGFRKTPAAAEAGKVHQCGGTVKHRFHKARMISARLSEEGVARLRRDAGVAFIEEDKVVAAVDPVAVAADPEYTASWGVDRIGSRAAHEAGIRGAGVKVAVLDTGIDYTHPDLAANVKGGDNFVSLDPNFRDYKDDSWNSHGTHVAGIVAAVRNASGTVGVAPEAQLYAVKVLDGAGFGTVSSLVAGLEWSVANGMNVVNISAALDTPSEALEQALRTAWEAGILVVAAAGNTYGGPVQYPAAYDTVVAVSATEIQDAVIALSSAGPQVELAAPGGAVNSTAAGGGYRVLTGTSQAAPHVAGVAALVLSAGVSDQDGDGIVTVQDLRLRLQKTARDLGDPGRDVLSGFGLVQASAAAGVSTPPPPGGGPEPVRLTLSRTKDPVADRQTVTLAGGLYRITITNNGLSAVAVQAYRGETPVHAALYRFRRKGADTVSFDLDAGPGPLKVVLTPFGRRGTSATFLAAPN